MKDGAVVGFLADFLSKIPSTIRGGRFINDT
jgi:hypothetical protein